MPNVQIMVLQSHHPLLTWTIPNVAEVTGSEKSPPGGDTLRGSGYLREKSALTIDNVPYMPINSKNCKANHEGWLSKTFSRPTILHKIQ